MDMLYKRLPKDLVYIIEDYSKDKTQYDKVIRELQYKICRFVVFECNWEDSFYTNTDRFIMIVDRAINYYVIGHIEFYKQFTNFMKGRNYIIKPQGLIVNENEISK